ncbi:cobalt-precorrin-6x reductase [Litchfieldella anticariensis FP35 = DSM 16096]|uniref:Cobalt-precorrin-6x reductase n=1 Tax=Litchfieldella anticariensis (strain DSM 16096 / CECT 5854 / CIP 108499 / LMG 22089 / FP35) TaxID=1121939 RepID=S2L3V8_LITA3|nr:cobalt-precorrin-6A reductase [Halomonas anticariensis]EPC02394.1 cobalt-precorrin-6x reductase [Halomonas anticariensis FP35 = DSM 16096]
MKVLILGGTSEASALASALTERSIPALFSYAGRVSAPKPQPLPTRVGGFGGVEGLAAFLADNRITHLVDATHPFAERMSRNAVSAAQRSGIRVIALTRPPWEPMAGDRWERVASVDAAVSALAGPPQRVLLAIGRMHLADFAAQPQHHYLLRLVDRPEAPPPLPHHRVTIDRGPFTLDSDLALLREHGVERLVCKNSGGDGAVSKLTAARQLGLPVVMIERPALPPRQEVHSAAAVLDWLGHNSDPDADLGV